MFGEVPIRLPKHMCVCVVSAVVVVVVARVLGIPIFGWGHYFVSSSLFPQVTAPCRRRRVDAPRRVAAAPAPVGEEILQLIESQVDSDFTLSWSNKPMQQNEIRELVAEVFGAGVGAMKVMDKGKGKGKVVTVGVGGTNDPCASRSACAGSAEDKGKSTGKGKVVTVGGGGTTDPCA